MKTIITITEMASMPGRFLYSVKTPLKRPISGRDAGKDPAAAAAKAVDLAICHGAQGFHIFAPRDVLSFIPPEFRSGENYE